MVLKKSCLMHVPVHYYEKCKVLKEYPKKYAAQQPHKDSESCSRSKKNVIILLSLTAASKNPTSWNMMPLFPRRIKEKTD